MTRATVLALLLLAACGDPRAADYVTSEPDANDLVGRYEYVEALTVLPAATAASVDPDEAAELFLMPDGRFAAVALPGREDTAAWDGPPLVTAHGTWSIARAGSVDRGDGVEPVWSVAFDCDPPLEPASILDPAPPHRLVVVLGDPDEGMGLALRRVD